MLNKLTAGIMIFIASTLPCTSMELFSGTWCPTEDFEAPCVTLVHSGGSYVWAEEGDGKIPLSFKYDKAKDMYYCGKRSEIRIRFVNKFLEYTDAKGVKTTWKRLK